MNSKQLRKRREKVQRSISKLARKRTRLELSEAEQRRIDRLYEDRDVIDLALVGLAEVNRRERERRANIYRAREGK